MKCSTDILQQAFGVMEDITVDGEEGVQSVDPELILGGGIVQDLLPVNG